MNTTTNSTTPDLSFYFAIHRPAVDLGRYRGHRRRPSPRPTGRPRQGPRRVGQGLRARARGAPLRRGRVLLPRACGSKVPRRGRRPRPPRRRPPPLDVLLARWPADRRGARRPDGALRADAKAAAADVRRRAPRLDPRPPRRRGQGRAPAVLAALHGRGVRRGLPAGRQEGQEDRASRSSPPSASTATPRAPSATRSSPRCPACCGCSTAWCAPLRPPDRRRLRLTGPAAAPPRQQLLVADQAVRLVHQPADLGPAVAPARGGAPPPQSHRSPIRGQRELQHLLGAQPQGRALRAGPEVPRGGLERRRPGSEDRGDPPEVAPPGPPPR